MKLLVFLFAVLAVVAMVSANNPMCNDGAQSSGGYKVYDMAQARAAAARAAAARAAAAPRSNYNYGSERKF